ncbi:MAG: histidine phosphatase family protein [Oscillospiraceae bacterium]|nr:histidine phosphatase family protein [Oscillospiraceae bacterium]
MTTILLVRHGESEANRRDLFAGFYNVKLEEQGIRQAELTARYLRENYNVYRIYASDLERAHHTGRILAAPFGLDVIPEPGLREMDGGEWEGAVFSSLAQRYPEDFGLWQTDIARARCTGGETVRQMTERVMAALEKIALENEGKIVAAASHATPIRAAMTMTIHGKLDCMNQVPWVSNASVTTLTYENGSWQCVRAGEDAHLQGIKTAFVNSSV